ncbi:MAG: Holliday junction resolvase RuvX [Chitinophagales bacterium]
MARILAIDYGMKRTGLAVTDPMQIIATGLTAVDTKNIFDFLKDYLKNEEVELFVVGYPIHLDGNESPMSLAVDKFIEILQKNHPHIPVDKEDERFTSQMAARSLVQSGVKKKKRQNKKLLDEVSAVLILQAYMGHR